MKLFGSSPTGLKMHAFSQSVYLVFSFSFFVQHRPVYWWPLFVLMVTFIYGLQAYFLRGRSDEYTLFPLTGVVIANSVLLNMDSPNFFVYAFSAAVGLACLSIFEVKGRHAFNPSGIGTLAAATLIPNLASTGAWSSYPYLQLLIFSLGVVTVFINKRIFLSFSYFISFAVCSVLVWLVGHALGDSSTRSLSLMFWPSVLTTPGTLIFAFHVISDVRITPQFIRGQIIYGAILGAIDISLRGFTILLSDFIAYAIVQCAYWIWKSWEFKTQLPVQKAHS
jgi:hypothetical protein